MKVNLIKQYDLDNEVEDSLLSVGNFINHWYMSKKSGHVTYKSFSSKSRYNDWWRISQDKITNPIIMRVSTPDSNDIDQYSFSMLKENTDSTDDNLYFIGGYLLTNNEHSQIELPIVGIDNYDNVLADLMASSIASLLYTRELNMTYAYLRVVQLLQSLSLDKSIEYTQSKSVIGRSISPHQL